MIYFKEKKPNKFLKRKNDKIFLLNLLKKKEKNYKIMSKKIYYKNIDPSLYEKIFSDFKSWVMLSIPSFKNEFEKLSTPLAFCFLSELLKNRFYIEARLFLMKFNIHFHSYFFQFSEKSKNCLFFFEKNYKKILYFIDKINFYIQIEDISFHLFINFFKERNFFEIFKFLNKKFKIKITKKKKKSFNNRLEEIDDQKIFSPKMLSKEKNDISTLIKLDKGNEKKSDKIFAFPEIKALGKRCKVVKFLSKNNLFLNSFDVSYDEKNVLTGWQDSSICVYENTTHESQKKKSIRLKNGFFPIYVSKFSLCSNFFLTGSLDGKISLWSTKLKKLLIDYQNSKNFIWDASFCKFNQFFATGSSANNLSLWDMEVKFPVRSFLGHSSDVNVVRWHSSGNLIGSGSKDSSCLIWDIRSAKFVTKIRNFQHSIHSMEFSPNGLELSIAGLSKKIGFWDLRMNRFFNQIVDEKNSFSIVNLAYSSDNNYFSYTSEKTTIKLIEKNSLANLIENKKIYNNKQSNFALIETKLKKIFGIRFDIKNRLLAFGTEEFF